MRPLLCCILSVKHECKIKMNVCQTDPLYTDVGVHFNFWRAGGDLTTGQAGTRL